MSLFSAIFGHWAAELRLVDRLQLQKSKGSLAMVNPRNNESTERANSRSPAGRGREIGLNKTWNRFRSTRLLLTTSALSLSLVAVQSTAQEGNSATLTPKSEVSVEEVAGDSTTPTEGYSVSGDSRNSTARTVPVDANEVGEPSTIDFDTVNESDWVVAEPPMVISAADEFPNTRENDDAANGDERPAQQRQRLTSSRNNLECPLDELRAAFQEVLEARTTVVIDYLTLENEVLRVCDARQVLVNRLLNTTASVEKSASELLAKKSQIVAKEWAAAEVALLEAKQLADAEAQRAIARSQQIATANVVVDKSPEGTDQPAPSVQPVAVASCRPDYRVTSILGAAGTTRANIVGPTGDSYSVAAGDALPFGVKIVAVGQGLVTIEFDGKRDVLAFLADETRESLEIDEEGFIIQSLTPDAMSGGQ